MKIHLHRGDIPEDFAPQTVAVDTETMGLKTKRDRLCLVQLSAGDQVCHLVKFDEKRYHAPRLRALMSSKTCLKIFHFARFDMAALAHYLDVMPAPVYCTRLASKLVRTYSDNHGLKELCRELLQTDISKGQQSSDWGAEELTDAQKHYAASDVAYLHRLKESLDAMLVREGRMDIARSCFDFLPARVRLDLTGFTEGDIFAHAS